jgi:hypothetical protein
MKFVSAVTAPVSATGLFATDSSLALGSANVVAPLGPTAEAEGASAAAQSRMSTKQSAHKQVARAEDSQSTHRSSADAASGPAANNRHTP